MVTVPATIRRSACLGELLGTNPNLSKSNLDPIKAANSMKQHAVPYRSGHKLLNLAQLCRSSRLVRIMFSLKSLVTDGAPTGPQEASLRSLTDSAEGEDFFKEFNSIQVRLFSMHMLVPQPKL